MLKSLRARLIGSFVLIVVITLVTAGLVFFTRLGGYRDQLSAGTLRQVAAPIYYNLTLFSPANTAPGATVRGQRLRRELTDYISVQERDSNVVVLLVGADGNVIDEGASDPALAGEHFDVPPPPERGPNFSLLPQQKHETAAGAQLLYVMVPMPAAVRTQAAGINGIVVALPEADARDVFRDLLPRLLFAGLVGLAAATLVGLLLWLSLYRPLDRVAAGVRRVASGNYAERVAVSGPSEVRSLASDVNIMAESVQSSQSTLRSFLANVSHELKTPLTSIRGFSQAMGDGTLSSLEEQSRAVRVIDTESRRVLHLVDELLDLSRIESGQQPMELAEVRVSELLAHAADVFAVRAEEAGVAISLADVPDSASVLADFDRIEQVLENLIDNALRHESTGGQIELGIDAIDGSTVSIYVSDDGDGIPEDELPHVFDRFYRTTAEASGTGSGLGLAISREIIEAHGGEISANARAGDGAIVRFTLPAAQVEARERRVWRARGSRAGDQLAQE